jgi:hypothetical protein
MANPMLPKWYCSASSQKNMHILSEHLHKYYHTGEPDCLDMLSTQLAINLSL